MHHKHKSAFRPADRAAFRGVAVAGALLVALAALGTSMAMGRGVRAVVAVEAAAEATPIAETAAVRSVARIGVTVGDLDRSIEFYRACLDSRRSEGELFGDALEHLTGVFGASARPVCAGERADRGHAVPRFRGASDSRRLARNDRWFQHIAIAVSDMDRAYAHLRAHKVRHVSTGPQTLPQYLPNAAGIGAFYFKDPDGHVLEVIHFPPGKGDPRWAARAASPASDSIFLGIDHTAIAVADTEASLRFYRDTLGLRVAGETRTTAPSKST